MKSPRSRRRPFAEDAVAASESCNETIVTPITLQFSHIQRTAYEIMRAPSFTQVNVSTPTETPINKVKKPLMAEIIVNEGTLVYWSAALLK